MAGGDGEDPLAGFHWNQALTLPPGFRDFLVAIVGLEHGRTPVQIGTGFVFVANGDRAIVLTAAHNISEGIRRIQHPYRRSHLSTPAEFLPSEEISAASTALRVIVTNGSRADVCKVAHLAWDEHTDLAELAIVPQEDGDTTLFQSGCWLSPVDPALGDLVAIAGFARLETLPGSTPEETRLQQEPLVRIGRVTRHERNGEGLHRSAFIETTIPVFSGMSGSPALVWSGPGRPLCVFGVVSGDDGQSSDPNAEEPDKQDRSIAGRSVCRLIPRVIDPDRSGQRITTIRFTPTGLATNPEVDLDRFAADWAWRPLSSS